MPQVRAIEQLKRQVQRRVRDETNARVARSAVVFAPHQDDETLGCGGTMILKCRSGTPLSCVFMTDGATSHQAFIDPVELRRLRKKEALDATALIGMSSKDVHFWDFPDGRLESSHDEAVKRVIALLDVVRPAEVYVPYRRDGTPDHEATYRIAVEAISRTGRRTELLEYLVWFWNRWPWVSFRLEARRRTLRTVREALDAGLGLEVARKFRTGVFVAPLLEQKRQALSQHRSQMTSLQPGSAWPTLADVSNGEFLDCFFQEFEIFRSSEIGGTGRASSR